MPKLKLCCLSPPDGRSLLLSPCLVDQSEPRYLDRNALESRVREMEEENLQLRQQLSQSPGAAAPAQEGNYGNQQWVASADTGPEDGENTAEEGSNHTECVRQPVVERCEVSTAERFYHLQWRNGLRQRTAVASFSLLQFHAKARRFEGGGGGLAGG